ncbi:hypothetical protein N9D31_03435, partial [Oligoflexaceae bacterium]|nr:hypothetical protein [Oligoflexaceae bacterium]
MKSVLSLFLFIFAVPAAYALTASDALRQYKEISFQAPQTKSELTLSEMNHVLSHVITHPVASLLDPQNINKYDPQGVIGFCFGRSMAVHLAARKVGLAHSSIRKLFIIGDMRSGADPEWRFHVTTIVKGPNAEWYALDPIAANGSQPR